MTFLLITRTATTQVRAAWCHWCLTTHGPRMCAPMRMAMADPPADEGPPLVLEEAPTEECPEEY